MKKIFILILVLLSSNVWAQEKAMDIAQGVFSLKESTDDKANCLMVLIDKNNNSKVRKFEMYSQEGETGRNTFIEFTEPADAAGTRFLTIGHDDSDDEQRLYLPALKKVRRISSGSKDGSFLGSDLNYYDMEDKNIKDFTYNLIGKDTSERGDFHILEVIPRDKNCPYSRMEWHVSVDDFFVYTRKCFDKRRPKLLVKTIAVVETAIKDEVIMVTKMVVDNHVKNHKTLLQSNNIEINIGLDNSLFSIQNLSM